MECASRRRSTPRNWRRATNALSQRFIQLSGILGSYNLLCWLHAKRVVKAIEVVEEPDRGEQLDDLAFVVKLAQLAPKFVVDSGVAGHSLRKFERSFFSVAEVGAVAEIREVVELLLAPAMPPCQGGMRGKSILAVIELRGANDRQLLQLRGYSACVHDRAKVRDHRAQNLRPMRGRAEHVGHIAALLKVDVVD